MRYRGRSNYVNHGSQSVMAENTNEDTQGSRGWRLDSLRANEELPYSNFMLKVSHLLCYTVHCKSLEDSLQSQLSDHLWHPKGILWPCVKPSMFSHGLRTKSASFDRCTRVPVWTVPLPVECAAMWNRYKGRGSDLEFLCHPLWRPRHNNKFSMSTSICPWCSLSFQNPTQQRFSPITGFTCCITKSSLLAVSLL